MLGTTDSHPEPSPAIGVHPGHTVECRHLCRQGRQLGVDITLDALDDDGERLRRVAFEVGAQRLGDLAGRCGLREHSVVRRAELHPQERRAEQQQDGDDAEGDGDRPTHHARRHAVPEAVLLALGAATAEHPQGVDAVADDGEQRRQGDDRRHHRQQHDGDAGVGERPQEVLREDEQRRERHGDGEGADGDRPACRLDRPHDRLLDGAPVAQLLPVAGDDEQAVVDGEAEPERGGQVDGVDRDVGQRAHDVQRQERAEHGEHADEQRQRRGEETAEHEHEQQQRDRDGDALRSAEVALDRLGDVGEHRLGPADADVQAGDGVALDGVAHVGHDLLGRRFVVVDAHEHEGGVAIGVAERRRAAEAPVRRHLGDAVDR